MSKRGRELYEIYVATCRRERLLEVIPISTHVFNLTSDAAVAGIPMKELTDEVGPICTALALVKRTEEHMPDDRSQTGGQDRARVAGDEPYEVAYFARKHGITNEQAREIIDRHGPSREACDRAVQTGA